MTKTDRKKRARIPLRIDRYLASRINLATDGDKKSFVEGILIGYVEAHKNDKVIMTPAGYDKSTQFVVSVKSEIKDKLSELADKHSLSLSEVVRNAFIEWDLSNQK